jgi:hypothetical protein
MKTRTFVGLDIHRSFVVAYLAKVGIKPLCENPDGPP